MGLDLTTLAAAKAYIDRKTLSGGGFVAQDTAPENTEVMWIDTSDNEESQFDLTEYINSLIDAKLGVIENGTY